MLQAKLPENVNDYKYTRQLRKDLLLSLNQRFGDLITNDVFVLSTFLDPNFGLDT